MTKFLMDDKVYIPVDELSGRMNADVDALSKYIVTTPYAQVISEEDFNMLLQNGMLNIEENDNHIELTKVETLETKIKTINSFRPLKYMFLSGFEDDQTIKERIEKEAEEDIAKEMERLSNDEGFRKKIEEKIQEGKELERKTSQILKPFGLTIQTVTELHDGRIGITYFIAGKGIFYDIFDEDLKNFLDTFIYENDTLKWFSDNYADWTEIKPECSRDFRNYKPTWNIRWCLSNLQMKNDFSDYVSYTGTGIELSIGISFLMKFLNPYNEPNHLFVNGIPDVSGKTVGTKCK